MPNPPLQPTSGGRIGVADAVHFELRRSQLSGNVRQESRRVESTDERIASLLVGIIADGFNRSLAALREARAIDCTAMEREYSGVGSKYYDLVTEQIERTARAAAPWLRAQIRIDPANPEDPIQSASASA